jgi:serine/threonine-protein kinase
MATVHLGRLLGPVGFSRTVAIKRLHAQFASDPEFVSMFLDEARLAARIRHPNVVPTLDVVATGGELFLVMEYVPGESIARLSRALKERNQTLPTRILSAVMAGVLHGLHAAHEAKDERGEPLGIVHRDMSPQNVLVGTDGVARVLDFGVAKAAGRMQTTREGQIKGKLSYMPPEQLRGAIVNRQSDIYAAGVMLWELVTGQRLFAGDNEGAIVAKILEGKVEAPSKVLLRTMSGKQTLTDNVLRSLETLDSTILRALAPEPADRYATAREMALEIERKLQPATGSEVADWVEVIAREVLHSRAAMVAEIESSTSHVAADGHNHVQSVLQAKATLAPSQAHLAQRGQDAAAPPTVRQGRDPRGAHDAHDLAPLSQTVTMAAGPPVARPPYHGPVDGPPITQPSSISVASGTFGAQRDTEPPGARRTALAAIIGVMIGIVLLGSALLYRYARPRTLATTTATAGDGGDVHAASASSAAASNAAASTSLAPSPSAAAVEVPDAGGPAFTGSTGSWTTTPGDVALNAANGATGTPPTGASTATTAKPPKASKPAGPVTTKPSPPPAAAPTGATADCTTPAWFDAQGVKHYKPQCLDK